MNTPISTKYQASRAHKYQLDLARYYRIPAVQSSLNVVLSLLITALFILFALRPTFVTIVTLKQTIATSEKTLATLETKVAALQRASTALDELAPSLPYIDSAIPTKEAGYAPLSSSLELLAQQAGVRLTTSSLGETLLYSRIFSPFTPSKTESVIALPYTIRVVGEYLGLNQFLQYVLEMDRLTKISTAVFAHEGNKRSTQATTTSLTISGEAYFMADQDQLLKALPVAAKGGT